MPPIRIANWNIEKLSQNKILIPGMVDAIARTAVGNNVDVLIIVELVKNHAANVMGQVSAAMNLLAGGNDYLGWFYSYSTGAERYGVIIRNMDLIRPIFNNIAAGGPDGSVNHPLRDLHRNTFEVWPNDNWLATAYPLPAARPRIPLTDIYSMRPLQRRAAKRARFGGRPLGQGGYSTGRGFRLPGLVMLKIHNAMGDTIVPIMVCHFAATRGGRNQLGQAQIAQLQLFHAAQLFHGYDQVLHAPPPIPPAGGGAYLSGYIDILNNVPAHAAVRIQELVFTGDFNVDFLLNNVAGTFLQTSNRAALSHVTPTIEHGGSGAPAALPDPAGPAPVVPFVPPWPNAPIVNYIVDQSLKASSTTEGTILHHAHPPTIPPNYAAMRSAAFDNFFYGGTRLSGAVVGHGVGLVDSGEVIDVPANVENPGVFGVPGAPANIDVRGPAAHHTANGTRDAAAAPNLMAAAATPLNLLDQLIGARFVSDHLPVIIEFPVP